MALGKKIQINTARFELITADGEPTGVFWTVESANNPRAVKEARRVTTGAVLKTGIKNTGDATKDDEIKFQSEVSADSARIYAACVTAWEWNGVALFEGEDAFDKPCTFENVLEVLETPIDGIDILNQLAEQVNALGKPKPAPKKS